MLASALAVGAQSPPQQAPSQPLAQPAKPKAKKVWTDDDLKSIRQPSDEYVDQKRATEQAARAAAPSPDAKADQTQAAGVPVDPKTGKPYEDPDSPRALERELKKWEEDLKRDDQLTADARRELAQTTDPVRRESAKEKLDIYEQNSVEIKEKIAQIRARLAEAQKQNKSAAPPPAAPPPADEHSQAPAAPPPL